METKSGLPQAWFITKLGISSSKYYDWTRRYGLENQHNGHIPRDFWVLDWEKQAIVNYCKDRIEEGYRRLTYKMIDEDIVAVSPSTVYRILKKHDLLIRWKPLKKSLKGNGFKQPKKIHQHWHIDIAYVNVRGSFLFLISVLDGYSRMILHHELRTEMKEWDVQMTLQRTIEKYPHAKPRLITDNGSQFISKDFKEYLRGCGLKHAKTSVNYPQSNGKIERFHKTLKTEEIRKSSYLDIEDARRQIEKYIHYYNHERLHSALHYLTPKEVFESKMNQRLNERQCKLDQAARKRRNSSLNESKKNSISA
ncbi:MAG: IS3 family transposase [Candidatus Neomarinimicrobiota bacterium]|nr:MAG: IS3 family transposase [Candidatus Neomarinimicrobiota bacterium]